MSDDYLKDLLKTHSQRFDDKPWLYFYFEGRICMTCVKGYEIKVLFSNRYYIGTLDGDGLPMCRLSEEYYKSNDAAQKALDDNSYTPRLSVENKYCSGGRSCLFIAADPQSYAMS